MHTKYIYKDQNITVDILFKIEHAVSIIAEKENIAFEKAYLKFLNSNVYKILQRTNNLMWTENAEFIVDEYYRSLPHPETSHRPRLPAGRVTDWRTALQYLKDGNRRYLEGGTVVQTTAAQDREALANAQQPFAAVVTCSDSRVVPEIYFDQKLGGIFTIRNAGHTATPNALGSIEFAVGGLGVPLIAVVGHSQCGAVIGAMTNDVEFPENLKTVIDAIKPVVKGIKDLDEAIRANLAYTVGRIRDNRIVKEYGAVALGAYYDIGTGTVTFEH